MPPPSNDPFAGDNATGAEVRTGRAGEQAAATSGPSSSGADRREAQDVNQLRQGSGSSEATPLITANGGPAPATASRGSGSVVAAPPEQQSSTSMCKVVLMLACTMAIALAAGIAASPFILSKVGGLSKAGSEQENPGGGSAEEVKSTTSSAFLTPVASAIKPLISAGGGDEVTDARGEVQDYLTFDGDYDSIISQGKSQFLDECSQRLAPLQCLDVRAGSIVVQVAGLASVITQVREALDKVGLSLPGFPQLKVVPSTSGKASTKAVTTAKPKSTTPETTGIALTSTITTTLSDTGTTSSKTQTATLTTSTNPFPPGPFECKSDISFKAAKMMDKKGMALDDTTMAGCPSLINVNWPHTKENISSLRLFKSWDEGWSTTLDRKYVWKQLRDYVWRNNVKVLYGTMISCSEEQDDQDWQYVRELMKYIGSEYAMGLAVGNEVELIQYKPNISRKCVDGMFSGGYFFQKLASRADDLLDLEGFEDIPLTTVMGGYVLAGNPFINTKECGALAFLKRVVERFAGRWVFTWNVYPYFTPEFQMDQGIFHSCNQAMMKAVNFAIPSQLPTMLRDFRARMKAITGQDDDIMWLGETGWSYPMATTLNTAMRNCKPWSTVEMLELYYQNFLEWDLSLGPNVMGVDHAFYFSFRDSQNFGAHEGFGLETDCSSTHCKIQEE
eukprot:TRINITY_DN17889_c0_g1_i1.p1 TRINITY_DN17889_c0_g1~~TRINITY_DN17889_c0_g1_i1.p1  ORF type:complete len:693 (+),score=126.25 TRINITY_DN17889_c0_g1_i1:58-2079(+)